MLEICQESEGKLVHFLRDASQRQKYIFDEFYEDLLPSGSTPSILVKGP